MKKIIIFTSILVSAFLLSGCGPKKTTIVPPIAEPTPMPTKPIEESIKERPYVSIVPTTDGHWVNIEMKNIRKEVTGIEYELTYFAEVEGNKIERGEGTSGKAISLNGATTFSKKVLFGSASCTTGTCKYRYDENVTEGMVSFKLVTPAGKESYDTVFRIQKGSEGKDGLTTGDGIFTFTSTTLPKNTLYLTSSSIGVPSPLPVGVTAKTVPYAISGNPAVKGTVSFKTADSAVKIMLWDGSKWNTLITTASGGSVSAETSKTGVFILVK